MRAGWEDKLLKDICSVFGRIGFRGYTKADFVSTPDNGAITLSPSNIIGGELSCDKCSYVSWEKYYQSPEIMVFPGDILLVKTASIGKCALVRSLPHEATINPQFVVLKEIKVNHQYLTYFLQSPIAQKKFQEFAIGAAVPTFSQKKLEGLIVPTPSLPEQQRIVDILDREFAKIDALKANAEKSLQAAKDLFQATLKKELEPKEGWSDISIGSVASLITKGASPKWQGIQYVSSGGILFITSENVREGFIDISLPKYVETAFNGKQARSILQKDDVLVNIVGASIGRAAVYTLDVKDANVNQAVALVRLNKDRVFPDYLCCFLNSKMAEAFYTSMKKDTARANLSLENISNIVFPCPKDITEQKAVAKKLHYEQQLCRQVENNYQKTLTLCDDLKQSLLRKAFNGEL